jgi:hypothetical protein
VTEHDGDGGDAAQTVQGDQTLHLALPAGAEGVPTTTGLNDVTNGRDAG